MAMIRFLSPDQPELEIVGVPVVFLDGVADIDDAFPDRLERMRFLGQPYGVVEVGARQHSSLALISDEIDLVVAENVDDPSSATTGALDQRYEHLISRVGSEPGMVPVVQTDGSLAFGEAGAGTGTVTGVAGIAPDPATGNVPLTAANLGVSGATGATQGLVKLAGDLGGTADVPTVPTALRPIYNFGAVDPLRPASVRPQLWVTPDGNRPATSGSTAGGTYAGAEGDFLATFTA